MWIYYHYCAIVMALVSLTWEIKGQPNCAQKQVTSFFFFFNNVLTISLILYIYEGSLQSNSWYAKIEMRPKLLLENKVRETEIKVKLAY